MQFVKNKVSIVIISYNHSMYIRDSINSVLKQTYEDIEIIVIDNNSTDNTHEILNEFSHHNKVKVIFLKENVGISGGINEGMNHVSGEYITFFASDDIMISNRIELQVSNLASNPDVVGCFGNMLRINSDNSINSKGLLPEVGYKYWQLSDLIKKRICLYSPTQLYRTKVFFDEEIIFPNDIRIEDIWLYFNLLSKDYKFITIPFLLTLYRVHSTNTHTRYKMMMDEKIKILNYYKNECFYNKALSFIYLEHFSNFCSTSKLDALRLLPKVFFHFNSKYLYIGLIRLLFDWRKV